MLGKSILRMKQFTAALVLVMIISGYAVGAVILGSSGYGAQLAEKYLERSRPNIRLSLIIPIFPPGRAPLLEAIDGNGTVKGLEGAAGAADKAWRSLLEPLLGEMSGIPIVGCTSRLTILGGTNYGGPLHLLIYLGEAPSNASYYDVIDDAMKSLLGKPWVRDDARNYTYVLAAYVLSSGMGGAIVPLGGGEAYQEIQGGVAISLMEPIPLLMVPSSSSGKDGMYYARDIYLGLASRSALRCLGIDYIPERFHPSPGDGVADVLASPVLASLLGIPAGSSIELSVGGGRLRIWALGEENPFYAQRLQEYARYAGSARDASIGIGDYDALFTLLTLPSELPDLEQIIGQQPAGPEATLEAYIFARYSGSYNESPTLPTPAPTLERPRLVPSLLFQHSLSIITNASGLISKLVVPGGQRNETSPMSRALATSYVAVQAVADLDPTTVANAKMDALAAQITQLSGILRQALALGNLNSMVGNPPCGPEQYSAMGLSTTGLSIGGITIGGNKVEFITAGSSHSIDCVATIILEDANVGAIAALRSQGIFESPIVALSLISLIPAILLAAWVMQTNLTSIIVGAARRWLAVAIARGMNPSRARRSLALLGVLLGAGSVFLGVLIGAFTVGRPSIEGQARLLIASFAIALAVVALSIYRKSGEVLRISPIEAVRPALSMASLPLPSRGRLGALALVLYLLSTAFGLARLSEKTLDSIGDLGAAAVPIYIVLTMAITFSPLAPLLGLSQGSIIGARMFSHRRVASIVTRLYARRLGSLGEIAARGGEKIRDMLLSGVRAIGLSLGMAIASALAASALGPGFVRRLIGIDTSPVMLAGVSLVADTLRWVSLAGVLLSFVMSLVLALSAFQAIRKQVIVLRARGASRRQVLGYVYASFTPFIVSSIMAGLVAGMAFYLGLDAVMALAHPGDMSKVPHLVPGLSLSSGILVLLSLAAVAVVPAIVSLGVLREQDLARLLREEV